MSEPAGKQEAQKRVERIHAFREQLKELAREKVLELTDEQNSSLNLYLDNTLSELAERYDVDISDSQKQISLGMRILSTLGGLAFCAAVFLFFYRFWGLLSTPVQVGILVTTPVLLLLAMHFTARREKTLYYTSLLAVVALASFVMNLSVLGTIFNIAPSQNAAFAWGVFALVLAYGYRFRLMLAAGVICLLVHLAATLTAWSGATWVACLQRPEFFLLSAVVVLLVPTALRHDKLTEFPLVYRMIGLLFLFSALLMLMHTWQWSMLPVGKKSIQTIYQIAAFAAAATTIWLSIRHRMAGIVNLGSAFFAIFLFDRLVSWWWDWMPRYLFFFLIGLIAVGLLAVFRKMRSRMIEVRTS